MTIIRDRFDFEVGYLKKSPCLSCDRSSTRPMCYDSCGILGEIQTILAQGVSCTRSTIPETFTVSITKN